MPEKTKKPVKTTEEQLVAEFKEHLEKFLRQHGEVVEVGEPSTNSNGARQVAFKCGEKHGCTSIAGLYRDKQASAQYGSGGIRRSAAIIAGGFLGMRLEEIAPEYLDEGFRKQESVDDLLRQAGQKV